MTRAIIIAVALMLAGCAAPGAPTAHGDLFQLNPDKWSFNSNDITTVPRP